MCSSSYFTEVTSSAKSAGWKLLSNARRLHLLSTTHKNSSLLEQQKNVWKQEYHRLKMAENKLHSDTCCTLVTLSIQYDGHEDLQSSLNLSKQLATGFNMFQEDVVVPLLSLSMGIKENPNCPEPHYDHIQDVFFSTRENCRHIICLLQNELTTIEMAVKNAEWKSGESHEIPHGIPEEFRDLHFPDMTMKQALLDELWAFDDKYRCRLLEFDDNFQKNLQKPAGWNEVEDSLFSHIMNMFPPDLINRQNLCLDLLRQVFPYRTLEDLKAQKTWKEKAYFHFDHRNKCLNDWNRERWVWLMLSKSICLDEQQKHAVLQKKREAIVEQKDLCLKLRKKVDQWHSDKVMEDQMLDELQSHWLAMLQREEMERSKTETVRRYLDKKKLLDFYESQIERRKDAERRKDEQLQEMKCVSRKRMLLNRERVSFRYHLSMEQQRARQRRIEEQREEENCRRYFEQMKIFVDKNVKQVEHDQRKTISFPSEMNGDALPEIQPHLQMHHFIDAQEPELVKNINGW